MNKRGEIIALSFAIVVIVLTTTGIIATVTNSEQLYIANKNTGNYFDYFKCKDLIQGLEKENTIIFKSLKEAEESIYNKTEGCI